MHQTPLLLTLATHFTTFLSTVDRNRYRLLAGHLYRTGLVPAPAQPSSPSGAAVLTLRRSRPHPAAVLVRRSRPHPARSAPPRPSEPGCARGRLEREHAADQGPPGQ